MKRREYLLVVAIALVVLDLAVSLIGALVGWLDFIDFFVIDVVVLGVGALLGIIYFRLKRRAESS